MMKEPVALAHRMADRAGETVRRHFRSALTVEDKADKSPVTQADREVEALLRQMIEEHFPDHGIVGEEYGNVRSDAPFQWVLDPIDGTRAFIAGAPTFTTLIALAKDSVPVLGIVDQPITGERWMGVAGEKTLLNGKPVQVRACSQLGDATLAATAMQYFTPPQAQLFERLRERCANTIFGGDAYLFAKLASGDIDLVVEAGLKPYDFCALAPVVEGAGGVITDWDGNKLTLQSDGRVIAAASQELHQAALIVISRS